VIKTKENRFPVVSGGDRGKRISNYITRSRIYTVNYKIKGDNAKIPRETIQGEECTLNPKIGHIAHARTAS
jgi:hypothetical protein